MRIIRYIFLCVFFMFLGCKSVENDTASQLPTSPISIPDFPTNSESNIPIRNITMMNREQIIVDPNSINPLLSLDINGNFAYSNMQLTNYYVLQSSIDLLNWTNKYIFYNETNKQISLNKNKEFFKIRVIDATRVHLIWTPSIDSNLVSYINVHYGNNSGQYNTILNIGNTNETIITNLTPNIDYFFVVACVDSNNVEGDFSEECHLNKDILLEILNNFTNSTIITNIITNTNTPPIENTNIVSDTNIILNLDTPISDAIITNGLVFFHKYDGSNMIYIDTNTSPSSITEPFGTNNLTVCAWIKGFATNNYQTIFGKVGPLQNYGASLAPLHGNIVFSIKGAFGAPSTISSGILAEDKNPHFVSLLFSNNQMTAYVDCVNKGSTNYTTPINMKVPFVIGEYGTNNTFPFYGMINQVSIYSRALSSNEISRIYNKN